MPWSAVAGAAASWALNKYAGSGSGGGSSSQMGGTVYDPFGSQRGQYQTMLSGLMNDPSSIANTPQYKFQLQQGLAGVNGSMAAQGLNNSGAQQVELEKYGQGLASQSFNQQASLLAQLSGAGSGFMGSSYGANQSSGMGQMAGMLGGIAGKVDWGSMFGGGGGSSGGGGPVDMSGFQTPTQSPFTGGGDPSTWGGMSSNFGGMFG